MSVKMNLIFVAIAMLAGCAAPNGGHYQNPEQRLASMSTDAVARLAKETVTFLASGKTESDAIDNAQKSVAAKLKDPESAKFRNVVIKQYRDGKVICGEVNAKNSYGGYVGFKPFVASPVGAMLQSSGSRYASTDDYANTGLRQACM